MIARKLDDHRISAETGLQDRVDRVVKELELAAGGDQPARRLATALRIISSEHPGVISEEQHGRLEQAIVSFHAAADRVLPASIDRGLISPGLVAAFGQTCYWLHTPEVRDSCNPDEISEVNAQAHQLQNAAHEAHLNEQRWLDAVAASPFYIVKCYVA